jgi:hypothetical protein
VRSRQQTIAIILSKFKKKMGARGRTFEMQSKDLPKGAPTIHVEGPKGDQRIASGKPVRVYRGIGSLDELRDAIREGAWQSKGTWTTDWEGRTQFTTDPEDIISDVGMGHTGGAFKGRGPDKRSYPWIVEIDAQGLQVIIPDKNFSDDTKFKTLKGGAREIVSPEWPKTPTGVMMKPGIGLGIGVNEPIPLDRIKRIYQVRPKTGELMDVTDIVMKHKPSVRKNVPVIPGGWISVSR